MSKDTESNGKANPEVSEKPGTKRCQEPFWGTMSVPTLRVCERQRARETRQFAVLARPDHQVPVVGHHAISQKPCPRPFDSLFQYLLEGRLIPVLLEDGHPPVGSIEDVVD